MLGIRLGGAALGYALHVVLARWFGAEVYGGYVYVLGWALLVSRFGDLGVAKAAIRLVPEYTTGGQPGLLRGFLRTGCRIALAGTTAIAVLGTLVVWMVEPSASTRLLLFGLWMAPLLAAVQFETALLRGAQHMVLAFGPPRLLRPLLVLGGAVLLAFGLSAQGVAPVMAVVAGALVVTLVLQRVATARTVKGNLPAGDATYDRRAWLRLSLPLLATSGFLLIYTKTDVLLLGLLRGPEDVGLYAAALQVAHAITLCGAALDAVVAPAIARTHTEGSRDDLQALARETVVWYAGATAVLGLGVALVSPWILGLFGEAFRGSQTEVWILISGLVVNGCTGAQSALLTMTGHERVTVRIYGGCAALNAVLNVLGILWLGTTGAALATTTTLIVLNVWVYVVIRRTLGIDSSVLAVFRLPSSPSS
mgnify:FL=1